MKHMDDTTRILKLANNAAKRVIGRNEGLAAYSDEVESESLVAAATYINAATNRGVTTRLMDGLTAQHYLPTKPTEQLRDYEIPAYNGELKDFVDSSLPARDADMAWRAWIDGEQESAIGRSYGLTRSRVGQILIKCREKLARAWRRMKRETE